MGSCERRHHGSACPRLVACEHEQQWRLCRCLVKVRRDLACAPARGHDRERSATEVMCRSSRSGVHGTAVRHRVQACVRCGAHACGRNRYGRQCMCWCGISMPVHVGLCLRARAECGHG
jgi:hypothetical protein